ncbi:bifunctional riboflavin kinase/FAD synthetase, partial [Leucobacter sp. M11]|uniref:bifunctional riboflavin kinase/FAD synthetase n=1 Tax=Leucobacter sp. M11 TaxID=2993565 RepID=UPI002D7FFFFF
MSRICRALGELAVPHPAAAVAIGKFDGIHLGHADVIGGLVRHARANDLAAVVFTFEDNPQRTIRPESTPMNLMGAERRADLIEALGPDEIVMVPFDLDFSQIPAEVYAREVLAGQLNARHIIVGEDFRFGHRAAGNVELLRQLGPELGFTVEAVREVLDAGGERISSTRIRQALTEGRVEDAAGMLGRPAEVIGEVVHGDARGRELGFPTANLGGEMSGFVPGDGVYAGWAWHGHTRYPAAISVGINPTFRVSGQSRVEAFLLDASLDLYGERLRVEFTHRLRDMVAYAGVPALIEQMDADVVLTRELLGLTG